MAQILIVEDEELLRWSLQQRITKLGHEAIGAADLAAAADALDNQRPDVMLLDLMLPDGHGLDFYEEHLDRLAQTLVIIMTAVDTVEDTVRAMKLGALDFLIKPVDHAELVRTVDRCVSERGDRLQLQAAKHRQERELDLDVDLVVCSPALRKVLDTADRIAGSDISSVLVQGETGTGKNVVARYLHARSPRRQRPILEVSCATIPENLLETELFGHEKGAFTDAKARKQGTVELADGGTLILDEIGEMKPDLQVKLLHFLEERCFRRVGGVREICPDVRVLALTNRNLAEMVRESTFRSDLYYRLNVIPITVPPLRERPEDVLPMARHFCASLRGKLGRRASAFTREAENLLLSYSWPGNVRELRNAIERSMILEDGELITPHSLLLEPAVPPLPTSQEEPAIPEGIVPLAEVAAVMVERAMRATDNNQTRAAELLGISRDQLRYRLKRTRGSQ